MQQLQNLRDWFNTGKTKEYDFRKQQLQILKDAVLKYEDEIYTALYTDLKKNKEETWITETGFVLAEINYALKKLKKWMQPHSVSTNLLNFPAKSYTLAEPLGVVLIISPWNYPLQLLLAPLVGAIAAGNCVVVKPSEFSPATSTILKKIITENFSPDYILFTEGDGSVVIPEMISSFTFNHIFYTGSTAVGKIIYKQAAETLTPVTLELGGKSPCIVLEDADIKVSAKRIVMTKFANAGQTCVAPDYVLVHNSVKDKFLTEAKNAVISFYGNDALQSNDYGKIINKKQFDRIKKYIVDGTIYYGGNSDEEKLYIEPTILDNVSIESSVMKDEIFGPVLPVMGFNNDKEVKNIVAQNADPLALYIFTSSSDKEKYWLNALAFGGGCINNAGLHVTNHHLPFGGRGNSGVGAYHGNKSFDVFSHKKSILKSPVWLDPKIKYPPFSGKLKLFKWFVR